MINDVTVFDFETTGLDSNIDFVIEIGALRIINNQIASSFSCFVNFGGVLPEEIKKITGITQEQVNSGIDKRLAFAILRNLMGGSTLVAHNAAFDLAFLVREMERLSGKPVENPFLCTRTIAGFRYPFPHKLADMCERFGISLNGAHRALNDATATYYLLKAMHEENPVDEFHNVMGYYCKYGMPKVKLEHATLRAY